MTTKACMVIHLYILCLFVHVNAMKEHPRRIGVIGAGIGGAAAAHYLRHMFPHSMIDVYEADDKVGGRLATVTVNGRQYEAGGSIIHNRNRYMNTFRDELGLKKRYSDGSMKLAFYDGSQFVFEGCEWTVCTLAKLFIRYGWDMVRVKGFVDGMLDHFDRIYDIQRENKSFTTVDKLLSAMDPSFVNMSRYSIRDVLQDAGYSQTFISELVMAAMRDNYGQGTDIHGFVGGVSLAGIEPGLWSVSGGNRLIVQYLLEHSSIRVLTGTTVTDVTSSSSHHTFTIASSATHDDDQQQVPSSSSERYDIVILAAPLIKPTRQRPDITFTGFPPAAPINRLTRSEYWRTVATFIYGRMNTTYFHMPAAAQGGNFFTSIMTTDTSVFFNAVGVNKPVDFSEADSTAAVESDISGSENDDGPRQQRRVWKVFSRAPLTDDQVNSLFAEVVQRETVDWLAYPRYKSSAGGEMPPFEVASGLYYMSGIEQAASAMEMSALSAHNVALLARSRWYEEPHLVDSTSDTLHKQEL